MLNSWNNTNFKVLQKFHLEKLNYCGITSNTFTVSKCERMSTTYGGI